MESIPDSKNSCSKGIAIGKSNKVYLGKVM